MRGTIHDPIGGQSAQQIAAKQRAPVDEFERKTKEELEARRAQRTAEGGRGGGHNDRQEVTRRSPSRPDEGGYDDFGRRIRSGGGGAAGSATGAKAAKADRTAAALERLRQKGRPGGGGAAGEDRGKGSRSRSRGRR
mmetsp:Transcript_146767/g.468901  ORF Transcript_146767/g.468901 Transcript_146767/m.468901 type:complete len:137 (+) Transcript_146767:1738-2148(+)